MNDYDNLLDALNEIQTKLVDLTVDDSDFQRVKDMRQAVAYAKLCAGYLGYALEGRREFS